MKSLVENPNQRVRKSQSLQGSAATKSSTSNVNQRAWESQIRQGAAATKSRNCNLRHRRVDGQICQRAAAIKSQSSLQFPITILNLRISILSDLICEKKHSSSPWIFDRRICKQNRSKKRNSKQIHSLYTCKRNSKIEHRLLALSNMEQPKLYEGVEAAVSNFKTFYTCSVYCSGII